MSKQCYPPSTQYQCPTRFTLGSIISVAQDLNERGHDTRVKYSLHLLRRSCSDIRDDETCFFANGVVRWATEQIVEVEEEACVDNNLCLSIAA